MTSVANPRLPELHTPQQAKADSQPRPARLEVATELAGRSETPQQKGNRVLAELYSLDLKQLAGGNQDYRQATVEGIPPNSSFGQSRALLDKILKSPAFKDWAKENDVDLSKEITINVDSGTLGFTTISTKPQNPFDFSPPKPATRSIGIHSFMGWPQLKSVAKTLAGSGNLVSFDPTTTATRAKIAEVAQFHGHTLPFDSALSPSEQQAAITQYINKWEHKNDLFSENFDSPSKEYLNSQASQLGDLTNRNTVIYAIQKIADDVDKGLEYHSSRSIFATEEDHEEFELLYKQGMQAALSTPIQIDPSSSYFRKHNLKPGMAVTLRDYLEGSGISIPTSKSELKNIAQSLANPPLETPAHGDLGGALSWPTPMSDTDQNELRFAINRSVLTEPGENLLDYLTRDLPSLNNDPRQALEDILKSPHAKHLAATAEREVGELASPDPVSDWVLTALYNSLDLWGSEPEKRTNAAGFNLADLKYSGRSASEIRKALAEHLILQGKATPKTIDLAVTILLSRKAPELLVKDIPEMLTKGTHSWVSFATAVARIEAQAPGLTSQMTYSQVMMQHELAPITLADKLVEQQAQTDALKDWGVHNGVLDWNSADQYSEEDMTKVRSAFKDQVDQLNKASNTFSTMIPDLHKMAIIEIKRQNPHLSEEQIKQKVLTPKASGFLEFPGPYSLLDIFINAGKYHKNIDLNDYTSSDKNIDPSTITFNSMSNSDIVQQFNKIINPYFENFESATQTQVKHLISKLPVEDRKVIEHGEITVSKELKTIKSPFGGEPVIQELSPGSIIVQSAIEDSNGNKHIHTYEIDGRNNTIRKREDLNDKKPGTTYFDQGKIGVKSLDTIVPDGDYKENVLSAWSNNSVNDAPNSFASEKTQYIADAMVKKIGIRDYAESLRGTTTFDGEVPFWQKIEDFVLGLIPGYSAIKNFINGNWREGLIDLAFDAFGFLLAGAGGAVRAASAGARTISSTFGSTAKKLLRGAVGALNPIDAKGFVQAGVKEGITYLANSGAERNNQPRFKIKYDPMKIFRNVENATIGSTSMQGKMTEIAATQKNDKWYALDPVSKQPFGLPLKNFVPST